MASKKPTFMKVHLIAQVLTIWCSLTLSAADWPQWRGPQRDGLASGLKVALPKDASQMLLKWKIPIGTGFSSPIVTGGRVYILDDQDGHETAHCLDAVSGKEIWRKEYAVTFGDEWGKGPRSTPFLDGDRLYLQSCRGEFQCLDAATGNKIWSLSFEQDFGVIFVGMKAQEGTARRRGNNGTAVIAGDLVVVQVGKGKADGATLVACDKKTGRVRWQAGQDDAAYSSLVSTVLAGTPVVLALTATQLLVVDLKDGQLLANPTLRTAANRHVATPLVVGNTVFVNSHTFGVAAFSASKSGANFQFQQKWSNPDCKINLASLVSIKGALYAQGPLQNYVCLDAGTGRQLWSLPGFGKEYSATIGIGETLLVLTDQGEMISLAANSEHPQELTRWQICGRQWNHPAVADGKIFIRDQRELACYELPLAL